MTTVKTQVRLPQYSGHPVGRSFQGPAGMLVELLDVNDWCLQVGDIGGAASWSDTVTAKQAAIALLPNSPAYNWYKANQSKSSASLATWVGFKAAIILEFAPPVDAGDKVEIIKSFKQAKDERVGDFLNRIRIGHERYILGLAADFNIAPYTAETPAEQAYRDKVISITTDYYLASFFLVGLHDFLLKDVTLVGCTSLDEMVAVAKRSEQAFLQGAKPHKISAVQPDASGVENSAAKSQNFEAMIAAAVAAAFAKGGANKPSSKAKGAGRPKEDITCFFCFAKGHYANECKARQQERDAGKWRPTVRDAFMTKEAYNALSPDAKQRGRDMIAAGVHTHAVPERGSVAAARPSVWANPESGPAQEGLFNRFFQGPQYQVPSGN